MKHKIFLFLFALVLTLSLGSFKRIFACSCAESTPAEIYNYADVVFVGKDIAATRVNTFTINGRTYNHDTGAVTFAVSEAFVGAKKGAQIIIINNWAEMCGTVYERGGEYIVYARKDENGDLVAMMCARINLASYAKEDLEFFRNILPKTKRATIFGSVKMFPGRLSAAQIKIEIQSKGKNRKVFTTKTDEQGSFNIEVPAGNYTLKPILPDNLILDSFSDKEMKVKTGGSHRVYISVVKETE